MNLAARYFVAFAGAMAMLPSTLAQTAAPGLITGSVVEPGIDQGIAGVNVRVLLEGPRVVGQAITNKELATIQTDDQGRFRFQAPEFGTYYLLVSKDGYSGPHAFNIARGGSGTQINATLDAEHPSRTIQFTMVRQGEIAGRIVDYQTGLPIAGISVSVAPFNYSAGTVRLLLFAGNAVTDKEGRFTAKGQGPGQYVIGIVPRVLGKDQFLATFTEKDLAPSEQDYPRSYWPGAGDLDSVQPISVIPGGSLDAGTIKLRKAPFFQVRVKVTNNNCIPGSKVSLMVMIVGHLSSSTTSPGDAVCGQDFLLRKYEAGDYTLILTQGRAPNRVRAIVPLEIRTKNLEVIASLERGVDVTGRFVLAEGAGQIPLDKLQLFPLTLEGTRYSDELTPIVADAEGKFRMPNVAVLGKLQLSLTSPPGQTYVKEIRYNGVALPDNIVTWNTSLLTHTLEIVVDDQPASISGSVKDGDRDVVEPYVVLVKWPLQREYGYAPPKNTTGGTDGAFRFGGLAPGEYRIFAVTAALRDKLEEPGVMQRVAERAEKLNVTRGSSPTITLKLVDPAR